METSFPEAAAEYFPILTFQQFWHYILVPVRGFCFTAWFDVVLQTHH